MEQSVFLNLLSTAVQHQVSDIHLQPGNPPGFRLKGEMVNIKGVALVEKDLLDICAMIIQDREVVAKLESIQEYDGSFEVKGLSRFRFNVFRFCGKLGAILRLIPSNIPSIEKLGLPKVLRKIAETPRGLVLVTGATGSGKSSTLAAMIDHINTTAACHILTIEDPVEFMHPQKKSRISQRELGRDTGSFASALRAALRQDPDAILVGEMRDAETIDIALKAAETGHLVFSTVHTTDAIKTIGRLVSVFPSEAQRMVRMRLADNLVSTISQRLLKRADGKGMVVAQEIMVANKGIQECIANPDMTGLMNDFIIKSREISGGQTFDMHLVELYTSGTITLEDAKEASSSPADFERNLMYGSPTATDKTSGGMNKKDRPKDQDVQLDIAKEERSEVVDAAAASAAATKALPKTGT